MIKLKKADLSRPEFRLKLAMHNLICNKIDILCRQRSNVIFECDKLEQIVKLLPKLYAKAGYTVHHELFNS